MHLNKLLINISQHEHDPYQILISCEKVSIMSLSLNNLDAHIYSP
jgi:hypothetical protein